ncbi:hypothetical protein BH11PLA1_BH11PLA1_04330 [soil metagenome]
MPARSTRTAARLGFVSALVLTLAAGSSRAAPIVITPIPDTVVTKNSVPTNVALAARFTDPGVTVVRFTFAPTSLPSVTFAPVDLALFDAAKPITVTNFKAYINAGRYTNTIIHRSAWYPAAAPLLTEPFVIQGGGYFTPQINNATPAIVPKFAAITNEPGISNKRGTIAMAKVGGAPNSATSEWFFNLTDRNATAANGALLDTQNGGFTVFGRVVNGLAVLDQIANIARYNMTTLYSISALNEVPLVNPTLTPGVIIKPTDFATIQSITALAGVNSITYTAVSSNPFAVVPSVAGTTLTLTYPANHTGSALITVTATSADGSTVTDIFRANVRCNPADIADDQGTPLPTGNPNNGVNEGDYNAFFNAFFVAGAAADIADDQGNPRVPATPGVPNNGVNEGDYNLFFNRFFAPCG